MENQQVNMSSNQATAGVSTQPQVPATALNKKAVKGFHFMKQSFPWRSSLGDLIIVESESSDDDSKNRTPNRSMEDLTLSTPPIIVKSKPKISLEAIPISPGILDLSVLNDSTPITNN